MACLTAPMGRHKTWPVSRRIYLTSQGENTLSPLETQTAPQEVDNLESGKCPSAHAVLLAQHACLLMPLVRHWWRSDKIISPVRHHCQDRLPKVSTGDLPIMPPLQRIGCDLEVMLRYHFISQPLCIPVEVRSLHQSTTAPVNQPALQHCTQ